MTATIIPFAEAAQRIRRRREPPLTPVDWFWVAAICALPVWVPVLVGLTVFEIVGGLRS